MPTPSMAVNASSAPPLPPATADDAIKVQTSGRVKTNLVVALWTAICIAPWLKLAIESPSLGWDFPVFYIAAKLPLSQLYNRAAFAEYWRVHLQPMGSAHWAAYVRPSFFSLLLKPLGLIPYWPAMWIWMAAGLAAYLVSVILLMRRFQISPLLLPAFACFFPAMQGLIGGGDTTFYLLALVAGLLLLEKHRDALAGICFVLCLCKFNLVLLVPAMLLLHRRYKALTVFSLGAVLVASTSVLMTPLQDYLSAIKQAQENTIGFFPVGLRGAAVGIGYAWCYPALAVAATIVCLWLIRRLPTAEALGIAITGSLMISPYVCWYDSTLLTIAIAAIWAASGKPLRVAIVLTLIAVPLWFIGGGFMHRPGGYMHVSVEAAILLFYACTVWTKARRRELNHLAVE